MVLRKNKVCAKCGETKDISEFYEDKRMKDGLWSSCKECKRVYDAANKEKIKAYRIAHKKQRTKYMKIYHTSYDLALAGRFSRCKGNAKTKNYYFKLTKKQFDEITSQPCYYCGGWNGEYEGKKFNGIDRISSEQGYVLENCDPCCWPCNRAKGTRTKEEFLKWLKRAFCWSDRIEELEKG